MSILIASVLISGMLVTKMKEKNGNGVTLILKKKLMQHITNMSYMIPHQVLIIGKVALIYHQS